MAGYFLQVCFSISCNPETLYYCSNLSLKYILTGLVFVISTVCISILSLPPPPSLLIPLPSFFPPLPPSSLPPQVAYGGAAVSLHGVSICFIHHHQVRAVVHWK